MAGEPRPLVFGRATGPVLVLDEALSFWGGLDPRTGLIIDRRHPQVGSTVTGTVLVMPAGRGSSSSSTILAEAIRARTAPAAIVLARPDPIIALGALVGAELYGTEVPVVVATDTHLEDGDRVQVVADPGGASISPSPDRRGAGRSGGRT
jgi:predicted aconitase with swiveling domain